MDPKDTGERSRSERQLGEQSGWVVKERELLVDRTEVFVGAMKTESESRDVLCCGYFLPPLPPQICTFRRPSSSSSVLGHAWSFRSGLTKGEACLVSGLRLGDKVALVGATPPCEVTDSSER